MFLLSDNSLRPNDDPFVRPKRVNKLRALSLVFICLGLVMVIYPVMGQIDYYFFPNSDKTILIPANINLTSSNLIWPLNQLEPKTDVSATEEKPITAPAPAPAKNVEVLAPAAAKPTAVPKVGNTPKINTLIIPKIGVNINIVEGQTVKALYKGAWRIPGTSTPNQGGNTVISAHRYLYRPPSSRTFYLLDKLVVGDAVKVIWEGVEYNYQVREVKIVEPSQVEILNNTKSPILTLFTCTPLFTSEKRLVVIADLVL